LADDHHLGGVVDEVDSRDLAAFGGGLHVDDAPAAAGLDVRPIRIFLANTPQLELSGLTGTLVPIFVDALRTWIRIESVSAP
jgi:hypothetical protein